MKRILSVWLPNWPIQRVTSRQPELKSRPCVLYEPHRQGVRIAACSLLAVDQGVLPGMSLAEAKAILNGGSGWATACFLQHDPTADENSLRELAWNCRQFTPMVGIEPSPAPDSLLLDVTGGTHLFGGELALALQLSAFFHRQGLLAVVGMAETIGAAWAIARYGDRVRRLPRTLRSLPVEALRLPEKTVRDLHSFDLRSIGQLLRLPRADLPSRFGKTLVQRINQLFGDEHELLVPERPVQPIQVRWSTEYPTADRVAIQTVIRQLTERLLGMVQQRHEGVLELIIELKSTDANSNRFVIPLVKPSNQLPHLLQLISLQMERMALSGVVSDIKITASRTGPLDNKQPTMFQTEDDRQRQRELETLIDRLSSRLGKQSVLQPLLHPDAQPEYAVRYRPMIAADKSSRRQRMPESTVLSRPSVLYCQPIRLQTTPAVSSGLPATFQWEHRRLHVVRSWGPERIETGWWRETPIQRDYYRVETSDGSRLWLFRDIQNDEWFLHGSFS